MDNRLIIETVCLFLAVFTVVPIAAILGAGFLILCRAFGVL